MDWAKVPYFILDLIQQVPAVEVEGLGRFEAIFHPALIDEAEGKAKPPSLEAGFDPERNAAGALLPAYMHYVTGIDISEAETSIREFSKKVDEAVASSGQYSIEQFGTFARTEKGTLRFTPDWDAFNLSFSGLEELDLYLKAPPSTYSPPVYVAPPPVEPPSIPSAVTPVATPVVTPPVATSAEESYSMDVTTNRMWWAILISALVMIIVLCIYLVWDIFASRKQLQAINDLKTEITVPPVADTTRTSDTTSSEISSPDQLPVPPPSAEPCFVVVGAFRDPANVDRMEKRLIDLGYAVEKINQGSLIKVAIRTTCNPEELNRVLNDARSNIHPEAWLY